MVTGKFIVPLSQHAVDVWPCQWFSVASLLKRLKLAKSLVNYSNLSLVQVNWQSTLV